MMWLFLRESKVHLEQQPSEKKRKNININITSNIIMTSV